MLKYTSLFLLVIAFAACKKDIATSTPPPTPVDTTAPTAVYLFTDSAGNCYHADAQGAYYVGTALGAANKVVLQVNVTSAGKYHMTTSTVNGFKFSDSGTFSATGVQTVVLQATGTPSVAAVTVFPISFGQVSSCSFAIGVTNAPPPSDDNDNMYFGNPSNAAPIADSANNYLMRKTYYAESYSRDQGKPNWVSWHLWANDLGTTPRQDNFRPDTSLPVGWYRVSDNSYNSSGFDRGHNCPSADRTVTVAANSSTFLMTNMIPQAPNHNQIVWARLEDSLRRLVSQGFEVYIIMGSYGAGGTGDNGFAVTIDAGRVTVPASIWKVAVVLPNGNNDSSRINADTRVIAVDIPNNNSVNNNWKSYRVSVDAIEAATGYNLLTRLPASLQSVLEARTDNL